MYGFSGSVATAWRPAASPTAEPHTWGITVTPNVDARAQILMNSEISPHAAMSGCAINMRVNALLNLVLIIR